MNEVERDVIRVRQKRHVQGSFSICFPVIGQTERRDEATQELSPSVCEEHQGSRSQAFRLQIYDAFRPNNRTSNPRRVGFLSSRKGGLRITVGQKDGRTTVFAASSEPTRGEKDLISRTKV